MAEVERLGTYPSGRAAAEPFVAALESGMAGEYSTVVRKLSWSGEDRGLDVASSIRIARLAFTDRLGMPEAIGATLERTGLFGRAKRSVVMECAFPGGAGELRGWLVEDADGNGRRVVAVEFMATGDDVGALAWAERTLFDGKSEMQKEVEVLGGSGRSARKTEET